MLLVHALACLYRYRSSAFQLNPIIMNENVFTWLCYVCLCVHEYDKTLAKFNCLVGLGTAQCCAWFHLSAEYLHNVRFCDRRPGTNMSTMDHFSLRCSHTHKKGIRTECQVHHSNPYKLITAHSCIEVDRKKTPIFRTIACFFLSLSVESSFLSHYSLQSVFPKKRRNFLLVC